MSAESNLLASVKRLRGENRTLRRQVKELAELLDRALVVNEALEAALNGVLEGPGEHEAA